MPIVTLRVLRVSPAAEAPVQVKPAIAVHIAAIARLQVCQPIACDIDEGCNSATKDSCGNQNNPDLARVRKLFDVSQDARCARVKMAQSLPLLGVFEDPINGSEVIVAYTPSGAFGIPVYAICVFRVL
jgi:hypothetical protein